MSVKLIAYTNPTIPGIGNTKEFIAYVARVSNPANQQNSETSDKLLNYLVKHKHWSPFEMAAAVIEINTTRDIARQILRHRSFSFQEFSQRYAEVNQFQLRKARLQDTKNRQNSIEIDNEELQKEWERRQAEVLALATEHYNWALKVGIAKEVARAPLPEGLTVSKLYMAGSVRSWVHYIQLRSGPETQKEHREIAIACKQELNSIFDLEF